MHAAQMIFLLDVCMLITESTFYSLTMHHFDVSDSRDFLFELDEILYLIVYVHMIDITINAMILRNDLNKSIQIF